MIKQPQQPTGPSYESPWGSIRKGNAAIAAGRRTLSAQDKKALPILTKKCTDKLSPGFGLWQEMRLVQHISDRLILSDMERRARVERMRHIDIQLSGVVKFDEEDKKRSKKNKQGHAPKPTKQNLPLAAAQLDDAVTYCMSLYAPEMNIFVATSNARNQSVADAVTREIGKQGQTLQYYRHFCKFLTNALKYNIGAMGCHWEKCEGVVYTAEPSDQTASGLLTGGLKSSNGTVWEGNVLKSLDMYNFFYDTAVHPVDLPLKGEFFAEVELVTPFRVRWMANQKILHGIDRYINTVQPVMNNTTGTAWYIPPPSLHDGSFEALAGQKTNFRQVLSGNAGPGQDSQLGIELVWYTTWIVPKQYDLSDSEEIELWRICMAQGRWLTAAYQIPVTHGQLPVACGSPIEDDVNNDQRSYAEQLIPLQEFASFLLNTHVTAARKALYGVTVYDPAAFPGMDLDTEDLIGARVRMKSSSAGMKIDDVFRHFTDVPNTGNNVEMIKNIVELMQKILPTNQAQQVADLERATEYQAAATVQSSSRRNLKIARLINDQAITPIKFQMMYNIYQNISVIEYLGPDGKQVRVTPSDILNAAIEFDIGTGLKGLDRLMQVSVFKNLMSYLFQVRGMDQQVDLLGLLSYVTKLAGFETDLSQFRIAQPAPAAGAQAHAEAAGETAGAAVGAGGVQNIPGTLGAGAGSPS